MPSAAFSFPLVGGGKSKSESSSFLKKRSKRLWLPGARVAATRAAEKQKFFGSFFQKRTWFLADTMWAKALDRA